MLLFMTGDVVYRSLLVPGWGSGGAEERAGRFLSLAANCAAALRLSSAATRVFLGGVFKAVDFVVFSLFFLYWLPPGRPSPVTAFCTLCLESWCLF